MSRVRQLAAVSMVVALGVTACGGDEENAPPTASATTTVAVKLQEFSVLPARASAPAGSVTFAAQNTGPEDNHELVVVKTDLGPGALPTKADGSVDEAGQGIQVIGEIEEFAVGETKQGTFELTAGKYVLFCNVIHTEHTPPEVHYKLGMRTAFTVS